MQIIIFVVSDSGSTSPGAAAGTWYRGRREPAEQLPECSNRSPSASKIRRTVSANRSRRGSQLELWYSMSTGRLDSTEVFAGARVIGNFRMVVQKVFCGLAVRSRATSMQSTTSYAAARPVSTSPGSPCIHSRNGRLSGPVSTASPVQLWSLAVGLASDLMGPGDELVELTPSRNMKASFSSKPNLRQASRRR